MICGRCAKGTDVVNDELSVVLRTLERGLDQRRREYGRRPLSRDRSQVCERRCGDHGADAMVDRGRLQRDRAAERVANQDDIVDAELIEHTLQIALLEISIRAAIALGCPVTAAVIGDHVETRRQQPLNRRNRAAAIVGDAMQIDDGAAMDRRPVTCTASRRA